LLVVSITSLGSELKAAAGSGNGAVIVIASWDLGGSVIAATSSNVQASLKSSVRGINVVFIVMNPPCPADTIRIVVQATGLSPH
jgi:hypothetical protein